MLAPDETFSISSFAALREASEIKPKTNISKTQAETTLNSFVAKGWLLRSKSVASYRLALLVLTLTGAEGSLFRRVPCSNSVHTSDLLTRKKC